MLAFGASTQTGQDLNGPERSLAGQSIARAISADGVAFRVEIKAMKECVMNRASWFAFVILLLIVRPALGEQAAAQAAPEAVPPPDQRPA